MLSIIKQILKDYIIFEEHMNKLKCVIYPFPKYNKVSKATIKIINSLYWRVYFGLHKGNIDYLFNKQALKKLIHRLYLIGMIK